MLELIMARLPCFCQVVCSSCLRRCTIVCAPFQYSFIEDGKLFASCFPLFVSLKVISVRQVITRHDLCMIFSSI